MKTGQSRLMKCGQTSVLLTLDQGDLPFARVAPLESIALQALARGYRHVIERLHGFTACGADANPFHAAALGEFVQQGLKWGWFRHWHSLVHRGETAPPSDSHEGTKKFEKTHSFGQAWAYCLRQRAIRGVGVLLAPILGMIVPLLGILGIVWEINSTRHKWEWRTRFSPQLGKRF